MAPGVPSGCIPQVEGHGAAPLGPSRPARNRLSGHHILRCPQERQRKAQGDRSGVGRDLREVGHSAARARGARGSGRRGRSLRLRLRQDHVPQGPLREGNHLLFLFRGCQGASGPGPEIPRHRRPLRGQLFRGAELRRLLGRIVLLYSQGCQMSDGVVQLFPHQCGRYRSVRAHAYRRRRRLAAQLYGGLYRPDA